MDHIKDVCGSTTEVIKNVWFQMRHSTEIYKRWTTSSRGLLERSLLPQRHRTAQPSETIEFEEEA